MADPLAGPSSGSRSSALRPYYVAPSPEDFLSSSSPTGRAGRGASSRPIAPLPARVDSRNLDLIDGFGGGAAGAGNGDAASLLASLQGMVNAGILGFLATAAVNPFEVGKVLMQVQWIPRADVELLNEETDDDDEAAEEGDILLDAAELEDEDEAEAYFHDLSNNDGGRSRSSRQRSHYRYQRERERQQRDGGGDPSDEEDDSTPRRRRRRPNMGAPLLSVTRAPPKETDAAGYIVRRSIFEQATKPEWILPFTVTGGVWDMMKAIARWKPEGWLGLWKGQIVTFCMETISSSLQPAFFSILASLFLRDVPFSNLPLIHIPSPIRPFFVNIFSHVLTGYLLSPLDLIRTRLIVQSSLPRHRKYTGPIHAFKQITAEEGGLKTLYTHTSLVISAVLDAAFRSIFTVGLPLFLERRLHITLDGNPIIYGLAEFAFSTASLLVILPIETVRRRLQIQSRSAVVNAKGRKSLKTCVETRPTAYAGIVETVYRILTEETGRLYLHNEEQKPRRPSMSSRRASTASAQRPGMASRRTTSFRGTPTPGLQQQHQQHHTPATQVPLATPAREMREWEEEARAHDMMAARAAASGATPAHGHESTSASSMSKSSSGSGRPHPTGNPTHLTAENVNPIDLAFANAETSALDISAETVLPEPATPFLAGLTQLYRGFSLGVGANFIVLVLGLIAGKERFDGGSGTGWTEM